jgi:glycogen debranching enzyme
MCVQMGSLAVIAEKLGMDGEAAMWRRRASAIVHRMIEHFWDEEAGLFWAIREHKSIPVVTPFNFYPMWTGQLPKSMNDKLLKHLTNPQEFWGEYALPTVAKNDPHYDPNTMWRGPIWANINYFMVEALNQIGEFQIARELREKTLNLIMRHQDIYEYYNPETGDPPPTAAIIFGWSAAVFIDLAIQASLDETAASRPVNHGE